MVNEHTLSPPSWRPASTSRRTIGGHAKASSSTSRSTTRFTGCYQLHNRLARSDLETPGPPPELRAGPWWWYRRHHPAEIAEQSGEPDAPVTNRLRCLARAYHAVPHTYVQHSSPAGGYRSPPTSSAPSPHMGPGRPHDMGPPALRAYTPRTPSSARILHQIRRIAGQHWIASPNWLLSLTLSTTAPLIMI